MNDFEVGDKVKLREGVGGWGALDYRKTYVVVDNNTTWRAVRSLGQVPLRTVQNWSDDFIHVANGTVKKKAAPAPIKAKHIYSVVYKDRPSDPVTITMDRALAREIKAELGGKAAGVEILKYKAAKEIR